VSRRETETPGGVPCGGGGERSRPACLWRLHPLGQFAPSPRTPHPPVRTQPPFPPQSHDRSPPGQPPASSVRFDIRLARPLASIELGHSSSFRERTAA